MSNVRRVSSCQFSMYYGVTHFKPLVNTNNELCWQLSHSFVYSGFQQIFTEVLLCADTRFWDSEARQRDTSCNGETVGRAWLVLGGSVEGWGQRSLLLWGNDKCQMLLLGSSTQFQHTNWGLGSVRRLLTQHQVVLGQQQHIWEFSFNQTLFSQSCSWTRKLRMVPTRWPSSPWFSRWWQAQPVTAGSARHWRLSPSLEAWSVVGGSVRSCRLSLLQQVQPVTAGSARHCRLGPSLEARSVTGGSVCHWLHWRCRQPPPAQDATCTSRLFSLLVTHSL